MRTYTIDDILAMKPCQPEYNRKNLERLFAGKVSLDSIEILRKRIPLEDKLWIGIEMLTKKQQRELACWCALQVIHLWEVPKIVLQYLKTQDESIRAVSRAATRAASRAAARDAAWAATWAAAWAASRAVVGAAAWAAAWAAARAAAGDAAWTAVGAAAEAAAGAAVWAASKAAVGAAARDAAGAAAWAAAGAAARDAVTKKQVIQIRKILKEVG